MNLARRAASIIAPLFSFVPLALTLHIASAQSCDPQWLPGDAVAGIDGSVSVMVRWDPDADGPQPAVLVAAGTFQVAGDVVARNIAIWDGTRWSTVGDGLGNTSGSVHALAVLPDGSLVAGGQFSTFQGAPATGIARWDGHSWHAMGAGLPGVLSLAVLPNGDLVAGGYFEYIARWNGAAWSSIGTGSGYRTSALAVSPDGHIYAAAWRVERWDGAAWSQVGQELSGLVHAIEFHPSGAPIIAGDFTDSDTGPLPHVAILDNHTFIPLADGVEYSVSDLAFTSGGELVAAGWRFADGNTTGHVSRFVDGAWSSAATCAGSLAAILPTPGGDTFVSGAFSNFDSFPARSIIRCDSLFQNWSPLGVGANAGVSILAHLPDGRILAAGSFRSIGGVSADRLAIFDGASWSPFPHGFMPDEPGSIRDIAVLPNGDLITAGRFSSIRGVPVKNLAYWNGHAWSDIGGGVHAGNDPAPFASALAILPDGRLAVGGAFNAAGNTPVNNLAIWDGAQWSSVADGVKNGSIFTSVSDLAVMPNGDLIAAGTFTRAGDITAYNIARWNGAAWFPLGCGTHAGSLASVHALAVLPNGDLLAGGEFQLMGCITANRIARWNGSRWSTFGNGLWPGSVNEFLDLPGGDIIVTGSFTSNGAGTTLRGIARWDGAAWHPLGDGFNRSVGPILLTPDGDLLVGGSFTASGNVVSAFLARWHCMPHPCPADFNADGDVNSTDLFDFLNAFFAHHADFNTDGNINSQDLFDFLAAFFTPC